MQLLIIEDDYELAETLRETTSSRFESTIAYDGEEGLFLAEQHIHDVILLDLMLPLLNGYEVLKALRDRNVHTPVLILTAKDGIDDKLRGFHVGADDYLVKPFYREELLVRLEAIVRRSVGMTSPETLTFRDLHLNLQTKVVQVNETILNLNGKQFDLLEYLLGNQGAILTKEQIFDRVWGFDSETSTTVVEVYVSHLRKNLKPFGYDRFIKTFRGLGYMWTNPGEAHV
ncbi:response regulator transcription factor [Exiguobacterium sp. SH1S21]|uniref:response regulator transcription factor n=1 Tax=Exiguobacterium sp. SH1S21 TaxID=2510953 RepID=UPI00103E1C6B|nr:response regulator transcription factor [Exiguobacterium sp. SH1S21]TCI52984.1 response regulator transcription factor [Exiguobacterium sp. SH1S21]